MAHIPANLLLVGCAAIWGFAFLFQKSAMAHVEPMLFVAARSFLAALVLAPLSWIEHRRAVAAAATAGCNERALARPFMQLALWAGVLFAVAAITQQVGIVTASVTNTAFLTALYVVVTPMLAWPLLGQVQGPVIWLVVALSFTGAWLLGGGGMVSAFGAGEAMVLVSVLFWSVHVIVLGWAAPFRRPVLLTAIQFMIAGLLGLLGAAAFETIDLSSNLAELGRAWVDVAYVGILASALTFTLFAAALRRTSAAGATIIASTEALFAALGAYLVLGERLSALGIAGGALILAAAVMAPFAAVRRQVAAKCPTTFR